MTTETPASPRFASSPYLVALTMTALFVILGSVVISKDTGLAIFLFDHSSKSFFLRYTPLRSKMPCM
jgi:hypothetical protein